MAFSEFPNARYFGDDNEELIALYQRMLGDYSSLLNRLNEQEAAIQTIYLHIAESVNQSITPYIKNVEGKIEVLRAEVNADIRAINQKITALSALQTADKQLLQNQIEIYHSEFINMQHVYNSKLVSLENEINENIYAVQTELKSEIEKLWDKINSLPHDVGVVNNPISQTMTSADIAINDLFFFLMPDIATYLDCENTKVYNTYKSIADKGYTYRTAAMWGITLLGLHENVTHMISPVSGKWVTKKQAINDVYGQMSRLSISAAEYDSLKMPAEEYDNKKISATNYDVKARYDLL